MKIFVAGATGVIGRTLVPLLVEAGHQVSAMTRSADRAQGLAAAGARPVIADVYDREALLSALRTERPEVVYHQLTNLARRDFAANNRLRVEGSRNLVDAALAAGVRRVIAQSLAWVYVPGSGPASEDEPLDVNAPLPRGAMVGGVQALEQAAAEAPEAVALRYGILYGPGTWYSRDGLIADQLRRGELAADDGLTSFLHVEDAAQAALQALEWPSGAVNIVDDEPAPGTEWLPLFARLIGAPPPPVQSGSGHGERGAANSKARRELGWQPRYPTWREGFRRVLG